MGRREDNKARKRADLQAAALSLFLRHGFSATSIEQIVAAAGVARGTFYLYFEDKEAVFRALVGGVLDPAADALIEARQALDEATTADEATAAYERLGEALIEDVSGHMGQTLLYYREFRHPGPIGEWLRMRGAQLDAFVGDLVASQMEHGLLRRADARVVALAIAGAIDRLVWAWLEQQPLAPPAEIAHEVVRLFGEGLVPRAG
jgi:AcrR family transcriptional regulator